MGLGRLLTRGRPTGEVQNRTITEFAFVNGQPVFGSELERADSYRGAMQIPAAWRCATLISDLIGSVPWYAYRERGHEPVERLDPTPLLLEQPNPQETGMSTRSAWGLDLVWHGNAVGIISARNSDGWPTGVTPVPASMVGVRRVQPPGMGSILPIGPIEYTVGGVVFPQSEMLHVKGHCEPGAVRGMGVLEAHFETLMLARDQTRQARQVANHGVPTGLLKSSNPDLTEGDAKDLKASWLKSQQERSIAVLNASTEFEPLSWNPTEMQLIEGRKFSLHEVALIFGVPLSFLGAEQSSRTYRNDETESINLLRFGLGGHLSRFENEYGRHLPRGTWVRAWRKHVLQADTLSRYQAHQIALQNEFLTVDEVRAEEDRPPLRERPEVREDEES